MSETSESLRRKINGARELKSVVRTMKTLAAASITQYEKAVLSLTDYDHAVELGLAACLRQAGSAPPADRGVASSDGFIGAIVFGSDQGLVGQFNDQLARFAVEHLRALPGSKMIWAVGERIHARLLEEGLHSEVPWALPNCVTAITRLVAQVLMDLETKREHNGIEEVFLFHNRPKSGAAYEPVSQRLLPLDAQWCRELGALKWPTKMLPQVLDSSEATLLALVREYLFVTLFKACAESLASENANRLAAMQRADRNIDELLENLGHDFHRVRQSSIDEELFDLVSGFEALSNSDLEVARHYTGRRTAP